MFDLGFSELIVIAIVLLIVVGPERLPGVARTAGHLLGRMQRYISDVKADIRREMQIDELKKLQEQARTLEQSLREEVGKVQSDVQEALSLPDEYDPDETAAAPSQESAALESAGQDSTQEPQRTLELDAPVPAKSADAV
ncbi:MAG: Sec-independent protein translocase protein TatB [Betaproteobacteria bacterium]|nr:Sec-independent protein translocase protein TatB [Betaproteobacteria bacterium]